jgi:hypothetical protein
MEPLAVYATIVIAAAIFTVGKAMMDATQPDNIEPVRLVVAPMVVRFGSGFATPAGLAYQRASLDRTRHGGPRQRAVMVFVVIDAANAASSA